MFGSLGLPEFFWGGAGLGGGGGGCGGGWALGYCLWGYEHFLMFANFLRS